MLFQLKARRASRFLPRSMVVLAIPVAAQRAYRVLTAQAIRIPRSVDLFSLIRRAHKHSRSRDLLTRMPRIAMLFSRLFMCTVLFAA